MKRHFKRGSIATRPRCESAVKLWSIVRGDKVVEGSQTFPHENAQERLNHHRSGISPCGARASNRRPTWQRPLFSRAQTWLGAIRPATPNLFERHSGQASTAVSATMQGLKNFLASIWSGSFQEVSHQPGTGILTRTNFSTLSQVNLYWLPMQDAKLFGPTTCVGFPAGSGDGHHFLNETNQDAAFF